MESTVRTVRLHLLLALLLGLASLGGSPRTAGAGVGEWTPFGPGGGDVYYGLIADPVQPGTLYAATSLGPFRSTDGGNSWTWIGVVTGLEGPVAAHPSRRGSLWWMAQDFLLRSSDGGDHWEESLLDESLFDFNRIAVAPGPGETLFLWDRYSPRAGDLARSTDGGVSWSVQTLPGAELHDLLVDPVTPAQVYLGSHGSSGGVFKSIDGGATFERADRLAGGGALGPISILALSPREPWKLWAVEGRTVWASADGAATWREAGSLPFVPRILLAHPQFRDTLFAAGSGGVFLSRDGGRSWQNHDREGRLPAGDIDFLAVERFPPGALYAGTSIGILRRSAGNAWQRPAQRGLLSSLPGSLEFDPFDPEAIYLDRTSPYFPALVSRDGGVTWSPFARKLRGLREEVDLYFHPAVPRLLYGVAGRRLLRSRDGGESWRFVGGLPPSPYGTLAFVGPRTLLLGGDGLWRSSDDGGSWSQVLPYRVGAGAGEVIRWVDEITVDPKDPARVHALILEKGSGRNDSRIFRSLDGGLTWKALAYADIYAVAPSQPERMYLGKGRKIFRSDDGGGSWQVISDLSDEDLRIDALTVDPHDPDAVFASFSTTDFPWSGLPVMGSLDGGLTWNWFSDGLYRFYGREWNCTGLQFHPHRRHRLYAYQCAEGLAEMDVPE